jgi:hypothetical protein
MDEPPVGNGEALDALRAWLLTEDAYERGGVPDEVLNFMQDHIHHLLGPRAEGALVEFLGDQHGEDGKLAELARDRSRLIELLALIEGRRRRGFEMQWRATRPPLMENGRPTALLVMAEYSVDDPVWDRPVGRGGLVELADLEVSASLVRRLREWNGVFEVRALTDDWDSTSWSEEGLVLAQELQRELPDIDVRYYHGDDDRPLRSI